MTFQETTLPGVFRVNCVSTTDERGYFARLFDRSEMQQRNLISDFPEHSCAYNGRAGTIRGLHYQVAPHEETKIIRCTRGAAFDVLLDIRADSPAYGRWEAFELKEDTVTELYVPAGIAHGYQTLVDDTELHYLISTPYAPAYARGFRYDSEMLAIPWPLPVSVVSARDREHPSFEP